MKNKRQQRILELISDNIILTQEELQNALIADGFKITQSTVSRDIKELRLIKGHDSNGNYRYICREDVSVAEQPLNHYKEMISKSVRTLDFAMNNVVIKSYTGMASSVCVAIDMLYNDKMLGSLAGDDTIFIVTRSEAESKNLVDEIKNIM
ncbi:MAG: arginine repressor [Oscillospiraceae bacterium]|nr:arginine repressor [Oscillospiraceae bacterium]